MSLLINPYRFAETGGGGGFDPLATVAWHTAFWAEDPDWTPPADGALVASWRNAGSGDWGDAASSSTARPTYRSSWPALNSKPAVDFSSDAFNDMMRTPGGTAETGDLTVVVAADLQAPDGSFHYLCDSRIAIAEGAGENNRMVLGFTSGNKWRMYVDTTLEGGTPAGGGQILFAYYADGGTSTLKVDGTTAMSGNPGTNNVDGITLGAAFPNPSSSLYMKARIGFIGVKVGALTGTEETDLLAGFQSHYGI